MKEKTDKKIYTVAERIVDTPDTVTLQLACEDKIPDYRPGQFITIYFPELGTPEGKAYSISSATSEPLSITVKAMGEFSRRLCAMGPGDTFMASAPSGYFYSESASSPLIMLAGGIGIAPFRAMILDSLKETPTRPIKLFYSNRTVADIIFNKELDKLTTVYPNIKINHFITREKNLTAKVTVGRIPIEAVARSARDNPDAEVFICGSISFTRDFWRSLKSAGISEDRLCTESFFSH